MPVADDDNRSFTQRALHYGIDVLTRPLAARLRAEAGRDVVANGHGGKWCRALEDHAHMPPQCDGIDAIVVDVLSKEAHLALDARERHGLVHAVEAAEQRGLAAARRPDDRRHLVRGKIERDIADGVRFAEPGIERDTPHGDVRLERCQVGRATQGSRDRRLIHWRGSLSHRRHHGARA
jgi:hypothetical protein